MQAVFPRSVALAGAVGLVAAFATAAVPAPFPARHDAAVGAVTFSPDGRLIASGSDDATIRIAEVATGKERHPLRGHLGRVAALAISPDGRFLLFASDRYARPSTDPAAGASGTPAERSGAIPSRRSRTPTTPEPPGYLGAGTAPRPS